MGRQGVLVALALVTAGAACSDDHAPLGRRAFVSKANAECRRLKQAGDALRSAADPAVTGDEVTRRVARAVGILRRRVQRIDHLAAPDPLADRVQRLVSTLRDYADQLEKLGRRAGPGESFAALQRDNQERVQRLNDLTNEANSLAVDLQLNECISGTP